MRSEMREVGSVPLFGRVQLRLPFAEIPQASWSLPLITDPAANTESIAEREGCSVRRVNITISLAFLAPHLVKAAIDGRLPHGMGVVRLSDMPAEWSRQRLMLGFGT
jgi:hypothetical protein